MKFQFIIGKYITFVLIMFITLQFNSTSAYPHLRSRQAHRRRQATSAAPTSAAPTSIQEALNTTSACGNCTDLIKQQDKLKKIIAELEVTETKHLRPAYECDRWDNVSRTCWLDRNIGDTVTFVLNFAEGANPNVEWRQEFHVFKTKKRKHFDIDPDNPMWNVVIGSRGHEMRLSPITEIDVDPNQFTALVVHKKRPHETALPTNIVSFRIRVMPVDQGFVYPGETLMLTMKSVDLPPTSMQYQWFLERNGTGSEERSLPSNMKVSPSGAVLTIWELRREQEGVVACSVYTNLGILATKKRFSISEIGKNNNQLLFEPTRPSKPNRSKRDLNQDENLKWAYRTPKNNNVYNEDSIPEESNKDERDPRSFQLQQNNGADSSQSTDSKDPKSDNPANMNSNRQLRSFRYPKYNGLNIKEPRVYDYTEVDPKRQSKSFRIPKYNGVDSSADKDLMSYGPDTDDRASRSFRLTQNGGYKSYNRDLKLEEEMPDNRRSRSNNDLGELNSDYDNTYDSEDDKIERRGIYGRETEDEGSEEKNSDQDTRGSNREGEADRLARPNAGLTVISQQVRKNTPEDYSRMISTCDSDLQCSSDALCVQPEPDKAAFCRCKSGFQGNGVFCWEENQAKTSTFEERTEDRINTPELVAAPQDKEVQDDE